MQLLLVWRRMPGVVLVYTRLSVCENAGCQDSLSWKPQSVREKAYHLSPHFMPCSWQLWAPHLKMRPPSWASLNRAEKRSSAQLPALSTLLSALQMQCFHKGAASRLQPLEARVPSLLPKTAAVS